MNNNELYHYGIRGMKWGVRRYQNADGSLTNAGKKRYSQEGWSEDAKTASAIKRKSVNQMSNAELKKVTERQQLERNYSQLNPSNIKKGMAIAGGVAAAMGTVVGIYTNGSKLIDIGKKVAGKMVKK